MKRAFPQVFATSNVKPVDGYSSRLLDLLQSFSGKAKPVCAVLTLGVYNSAYFERFFLARQMGVELVEGRDLVLTNDVAHLRTTKGLRQVDVLYRRVDDAFLDPTVFNPASLLGVPGIMNAYVMPGGLTRVALRKCSLVVNSSQGGGSKDT